MIKDLLAFFTVIPVKGGDLNKAAKYFYLTPVVVGLPIGLISGSIGYFLSFMFSGFIPGVISLLVSMLLTGFHHIDGLMDFADGVMAHGSINDKIRVLHDKYSGSAAVSAAILTISISMLSVSKLSSLNLLIAFIVSDVLARFSAVLSLYIGPKPLFDGLGYLFSNEIYRKHSKLISSLLLVMLLSIPLSPFKSTLSTAFTILICIILTRVAKRNFGGVSGDVCGAIIECSRTSSLLIFSI